LLDGLDRVTRGVEHDVVVFGSLNVKSLRPATATMLAAQHIVARICLEE